MGVIRGTTAVTCCITKREEARGSSVIDVTRDGNTAVLSSLPPFDGRFSGRTGYDTLAKKHVLFFK